MRSLLSPVWLLFLPGFIVAAEPAADFKLPDEVAKKWAARVKEVVTRDGWQVFVRGNDIVVRRNEAVAMARTVPNASVDAKPMPDGEKTIEFVLRFAPKMSLEEYERVAAINAASDKEYDRLHRAVGLPHKFDSFIATTPEEKKRVADFHAAVAKLPRHDLPDLYTTDHSIQFLHPYDGWSYPSDKDVASECRDVQETLIRFFGIYDPLAAARGREVGRYQK